MDELTEQMHQFVAVKGWYSAESTKPQTLKNIAISLCLESTELLEHFQWQEQSRSPQELSGEVADIALYLLQFASLSGIDLEQAILSKLAINQQRQWASSEPQR